MEVPDYILNPSATEIIQEVPAATTTTPSSNKIKITKPPRFTGEKENWEGLLLAVDNYLMAYTNEFKDDKQKIWFIISYLGMEDGLPCVVSDWL